MDKDERIAELEKELERVKKDRDKYIKWVSDLRGSLHQITSIAGHLKNWN